MGDLCNIKWINFSSQICDAFHVIQKDEDLRDVTLICDDGEIDAHRLILFCGSEFFRRVLNKSKHQHPLLYIRGVKIALLKAILNFLYMGEVRVAKEDLLEFFSVATDLKIKGLIEKENDKLVFSEQEVSNETFQLDVEDTVKDEHNYMNKGTGENFTKSTKLTNSQHIPNKELLEVGSTYASKEEVLDHVDSYCDSKFSPLVVATNSVSKSNVHRMIYKCSFGNYRKSIATGLRKVTSKYVGCPVKLTIQSAKDQTYLVKTSELEHQGHEIGEEHYSKHRKRLSRDQEDAVKAFLESNPSNQTVAEFLHDLTGKQYSSRQARFVVNKVKNKK